MYCPLCGAEYRSGFTVCSDCQVDLVPDPPHRSSAEGPGNVDAGSKSFTLVWSGSDPRVHAEICEALQGRGIPVRSLNTDDLLFNLSMQPARQVYVPTDCVNSAREAIKQVNAVEESLEEESGRSESDALELPAEEAAPNDDYEDNEERYGSSHFDPEDATAEIWSGADVDLAAMIRSSLRENHIAFRSDSDTPKPQAASEEMLSTSLFVLPADENRAKDIVREIVEAAPPQ